MTTAPTPSELLALRADFLPRLEREARAAVTSTIDAAAARHLAEMRLSSDIAAIQRTTPNCRLP